MIKASFQVSEEEKSRILSLHESATKKLYLVNEEEQVEVSFGIPRNTHGGSYSSVGVTGTKIGDSVTIRIPNDAQVYAVPDKGDLEMNPSWVVTPDASNQTPLDIWVRRLSGMLTKTSNPGFYWIPTIDLMNRPVWVNVRVYDKKVRTKKGIGSIVGLGKRVTKQFAELVGTYPASV